MKNKFILILLCFLCFGFIFFNSSQVSKVSNTRSRGIVNEVITVASKTKPGRAILNKVTPSELNLIVRKIAHGFEYFLFALALCFTIRYFNVDDNNLLIYTLFIVLFVAVMDEFFQLFIQDRTSKVADILIDFCGGILSTTLFLIYSQPRGKHYEKTVDRKNFLWRNSNEIFRIKKYK